MSITAQTNYAPDAAGWTGTLAVAALFACVNLPSVAVWAWMGVQVKRFLGTGARLRAFNIAMALLLVASLIPIVMG